MFYHIAGSGALLTVFQAHKTQPNHETTALMDLEDPDVELHDSPLLVTQLDLPPPTEPVTCSRDLPMEHPPQRCPGGLSFIVNTVETPITPLMGLIQFAPPMGVEDWEGEDPEDLYTPLWMDRQKMTDARELLNTFLKQNHNQLNIVYTKRLYTMLAMLNFYLDMNRKLSWQDASQMAATAGGCGQYLARRVRQWTLHWVTSNYDPQFLPLTNYGRFNTQALQDEDLSNRIQLHLQELAKKYQHIRAQDIVNFVSSPEMQGCMGTKRSTISVYTARRWLKAHEWRYRELGKGMYKDGHEREDVVEYRAGFLKRFAEYEHRMELYDRDGATVKEPDLLPGEKQLRLYTHDESTFYANDRRKTKWTHKDEDMVPQPKDSGVSIMVSEFLSPDEGRLTHNGR